jgi:hypothetical protein
VQGNRFTVMLNGEQVTEFVNADPNHVQPSTPAASTYVGLQIHPGSRMTFRNIEYKAV